MSEDLHEKVPHWLVAACDVDDTLLAVEDRGAQVRAESIASLGRLCTGMQQLRFSHSRRILWGTATGRMHALHQQIEAEVPEFARAVESMDFKITGVGTEVYEKPIGGNWRKDESWPPVKGWDRNDVDSLLHERPELTRQEDIAQGSHKISYYVEGVDEASRLAYMQSIAADLSPYADRTEAIFSTAGSRTFLDIVPKGVSKGSAFRHVATTMVKPHAGETVYTVAAGNGLNDVDMFKQADFSIAPSNADDALLAWATESIPEDRLYIAKTPFAAGVLEGMRHLRDRGIIHAA